MVVIGHVIMGALGDDHAVSDYTHGICSVSKRQPSNRVTIERGFMVKLVPDGQMKRVVNG